MSIDPIGIRISGPLAGFAEGYGVELTQLGYAPASVRLQMKVFADLSDWLLSHRVTAADLRRSDLDRFLCHRRATGHTRYASDFSVATSAGARNGFAEPRDRAPKIAGIATPPRANVL